MDPAIWLILGVSALTAGALLTLDGAFGWRLPKIIHAVPRKLVRGFEVVIGLVLVIAGIVTLFQVGFALWLSREWT
ncbi:MAG: hypothetical protein HY704_01310 [Gemmatimonadetes bacterium]|nr:hypothetical protein [Gemmatimonadota bacterium]